jgi:hypothetical protein
MGALQDRLQAEPDQAKREQIKLEAINDRLDQFVGRTVTRRNFTMTLTDVQVAPAPSGVPILTLVVKVVNNNNGNDVTPPDLNPILIRNPNILVADPSGEVNLGDGDRAREDIVEATLDTLRDLLRSRVG